MPRFSLRTLIVVMLLGGPVAAIAWWAWEKAGNGYRGPVNAIVAGSALAIVSLASLLMMTNHPTD
jgi:hypothetical protein